jgi:membrane fusion protein, multidrug efflux system
MRKFMTFGIPTLILLAALAVTMLMISRSEDPERRHSPKRSVVVKVAIAEPRTIRGEIRAYGTLESVREFDLIAEVGGILEEGDIPFLPGQSFLEGQVLLRVDERPTRYRLAQLKSAFLTSMARLVPELELDFPEEAKPWSEYFAALEIEGPMSDLPPVESEKIKLYLARNSIYQGFYDIRAQELLLSKAAIRADFDGVIAETNFRVGASTMTGGRLGRILSLEDLEIEVALPADEVAWLDPQARVAISSSDRNWTGRILRIGGLIDAATQTLPIFVAIEGENLPPVGSFIEARFPTRKVEDGLRVPRSTLQRENEIYLVESGRLVSRDVEIARYEDESVILASGFAAGDSIIIEALEGVIPGMKARARVAKEGGSR